MCRVDGADVNAWMVEQGWAATSMGRTAKRSIWPACTRPPRAAHGPCAASLGSLQPPMMGHARAQPCGTATTRKKIETRRRSISDEGSKNTPSKKMTSSHRAFTRTFGTALAGFWRVLGHPRLRIPLQSHPATRSHTSRRRGSSPPPAPPSRVAPARRRDVRRFISHCGLHRPIPESQSV